MDYWPALSSAILEWWNHPAVQQCLPYAMILGVYVHLYTSMTDVERTLQRKVQRLEARVKTIQNTVDEVEESLQPFLVSIDDKLDDLSDFVRNKVVLKKFKDVK